MHDKLFNLGISHTYAPYSGSHSGSIYQKLEDSFQFHSDYFSSIEFGLPGDVNDDGLLNVLDIVVVVSFILNNASPNNAEFNASQPNSFNALENFLMHPWRFRGRSLELQKRQTMNFGTFKNITFQKKHECSG